MRQQWYDSESKPVGLQTDEGSVLDLKNITQFPGEWSGVVYTCAIWVEELAGLRSTRSLTLLGPGNKTHAHSLGTNTIFSNSALPSLRTDFERVSLAVGENWTLSCDFKDYSSPDEKHKASYFIQWKWPGENFDEYV